MSLVQTGTFANEAFREEKKRRKGNSDVGKIVNSIRGVHGVTLSDEFARKLEEDILNLPDSEEDGGWDEWRNKSRETFYLSDMAINQIVEECLKWREYLQAPEDFENLLRMEVGLMLKSHVSVISCYFCEKEGILLKEFKPGYSYAVIIDREGRTKEVH